MVPLFIFILYIMNKENTVFAHASMFMAGAIWGLSAPVGKVVMSHGMNGLQLVSLRMAGACACFWLASLFAKREHVPLRDLLRLLLAGLLAIGFNQTMFTVGLSMTSPVNAAIMTTTMPIATMILSFLFLREPITWKKLLGILLGATGAVMLVMFSARGDSHRSGNPVGDMLVVMAQFSFAAYLTAFKKVIHRYSGITCMKWMFLSSLLFVVPFTAQSFASFKWQGHDLPFWSGTFYVVFGATFLAYLFLMFGQKKLRPTVVSIYNYVQPVVACLVSAVAGLAVFGLLHAAAICMVFGGVWLVTRSKSRAQQLQEEAAKRSMDRKRG